MKIHRFIGQFDLSGGIVLVNDIDLVHQINRVLKLAVGEVIILGDGDGNEVKGEIVEVTKKQMSVKVIERYKNINDPKRNVVLYCAILKKDNFDLIVQKATEVGVSEIYPVITNRTIKKNVNLERLNKIAKEAAEQSGRGSVPIVHDSVQFEDAIEQSKANDKNFFFHTALKLMEVKKIEPLDSVGLFIGPEGGWDDSEVDLAKESGLIFSSLGDLVLRGETAAIVATYLMTST